MRLFSQIQHMQVTMRRHALPRRELRYACIQLSNENRSYLDRDLGVVVLMNTFLAIMHYVGKSLRAIRALDLTTRHTSLHWFLNAHREIRDFSVTGSTDFQEDGDARSNCIYVQFRSSTLHPPVHLSSSTKQMNLKGL